MNIPQKIKKAEHFAQVGQLDSAIAILKDVIERHPKQAQANGLLGLLYIFKKDTYLAEQYLIQSLQTDFNNNVAINLTKLLIQQQRWHDAYSWSKRLAIKSPRETQIQLNHAQILRNLNKIQEAFGLYQKLIKDHPRQISTYISYGYALNKLERYKEAVDVYLNGLKIKPDEFALLYNLGVTYLNLFDYDNSLEFLTLALKQNRQSIDLWLTIAACQAKKRDYDSAFNSINEAQKLDANNLLVPFQMGTILLQQDKNTEALEWLNKVINKESEHIEANYHKGLIYLKDEKYKEAMTYYKYRVIRKNNRFGKFDDFELPVIKKDSNLTISWEQGIGDEILYLGLLSKIQQKVKSITYITQDKLYDWIKLNLTSINVFKESESEGILKTNVNHIELNIASLLFYIDNWHDYFKQTPVWKVDEELCQQYLQKYKPKNENVLGVSWMSANKKIGDEKTIPLDNFAPILQNVRSISLQYGDVKNEIDEVNKKNNINLIQDQELDYFNDINRLAALISICDVVVTCSNVTAHIAGRLGVKTYLMIPKSIGTIWYWNTQSNYSKWYPSVKIYRQQIDGDWRHLIEKIKLEVLN